MLRQQSSKSYHHAIGLAGTLTGHTNNIYRVTKRLMSPCFLEHLSIPSWLLIGRDGNVHHLPLLFFP
jgi:hypothetical protein